MGYRHKKSRRLWPSGLAILWFLTATSIGWSQNAPELLRRATVLYDATNGSSAKSTVALTFDPECPVCKDAREELTRMSQSYRHVDFYFILKQPNARITAAAHEYVEGVRCKLVLDNGIVHELGARVMPEAFVFNEAGELIYSGAIDDYFYKLGRRRAKISHRYVEEALKAIAEGRKPATTRIEPIGCFIER